MNKENRFYGWCPSPPESDLKEEGGNEEEDEKRGEKGEEDEG